MKLNAKGMLSKGFLKTKDDPAQFDRNNYGQHYMGTERKFSKYGEDKGMGYDNHYAMGDKSYPKEYMSGMKNYGPSMERSTKRIMKKG